MVTFTKLFVMSTVAKRVSELSSKLLIFSSEGCLRSSMSLRSVGESEKKAISDAEAKPDANKSAPAAMMASIADKEGVTTVIPLNISANRLK